MQQPPPPPLDNLCSDVLSTSSSSARRRRVRRKPASWRLYPARYEVEAVAIPDCDEVFRSVANRRNSDEKLPNVESSSFVDCWRQRPRRDSGRQLNDCTPPAPSSVRDERTLDPSFRRGRYKKKSSLSSLSSCSSIPGAVSVSEPACFEGEDSVQRQPRVSTSSISSNDHAVKKPAAPAPEIEVSPGVFRPLVYGARETHAALVAKELLKQHCVVCTVEFGCHRAATLVVCPICLVVNSTQDSDNSISAHPDSEKRRQEDNVGLGVLLSES